MKKHIAWLLLGLSVVGCSGLTPTQQRVLTGGALGAAGGAVVGGLAGGSPATGAVIGGAAGAVGGALIK
jgi:osmotically inducible lipoprotein OsmB